MMRVDEALGRLGARARPPDALDQCEHGEAETALGLILRRAPGEVPTGRTGDGDALDRLADQET